MLSRRRLLATVGLAGGATLALRPGELMAQTGPSSRPLEGERIGNLIVLPEGAPMPQVVEPAKRMPPALCNVGNIKDRNLAETIMVKSPDELAGLVDFPLYVPDLTWGGGFARLYPDGEPYSGTMSFDTADCLTKATGTNVSITAFKYFLKPLPLYESYQVEPDGPSVKFQRVSFLPGPGVMSRSAEGFAFHWIAQNVYYFMTVENNCALAQATAVMKSLKPAGASS